MLFSILLLAAIIYVSFRVAPRERQEDAHIHGAGQVGLLAAVALFGVDYFTSYFYATGEMIHALHPYGLEHYAYVAVVVIAIANVVFGGLYMYSLGVFNEGGGSFTAAMRYLGPSLSLVVAVILLLDYVFTIVVSTLSGVDQLLSLQGAGGIPWFWHFLIGAAMVATTWYITIRGRGESARVVFTGLGIFALMTLAMVIGLFIAQGAKVAPLPGEEVGAPASVWEALFHLVAASMKGLVALTGLEAMSDGIQFVINEDAGFVKWGKKRLPKLDWLWKFYSGKSGIGRFVQTSFIFYGATTTLMLTYFAIHFQAFDGIQGRTLVGNLALIGFTQFPGGNILFWAYQILAVGLLTAASMTAFQDLQAITWRNVAIGEIPEVVVYRNPKGTFTRPVTAAAIVAVVIQFLVRGNTSAAVPYYGVGVFVPIAIMGLAIRAHIKEHMTGAARRWGMLGTTFSVALATFIFVGQIVTKWNEGGWVVLIVFALLILMAHAILLSPAGYRDPDDIHRIIREKSRIQGKMGNIVEWQSLRIQEYRYTLMMLIARFFGLFGVFKPLRFDDQAAPLKAGDFEAALTHDEQHTFLEQYLESQPKPEPRLGGAPKETAPGDEEKG
ncbi:MAG: APC family permease [Chloroflexi bacterium]|nr:MAG: APC family permease [Chloroflexota bacterium]